MTHRGVRLIRCLGDGASASGRRAGRQGHSCSSLPRTLLRRLLLLPPSLRDVDPVDGGLTLHQPLARCYQRKKRGAGPRGASLGTGCFFNMFPRAFITYGFNISRSSHHIVSQPLQNPIQSGGAPSLTDERGTTVLVAAAASSGEATRRDDATPRRRRRSEAVGGAAE